MIRSAVRARPFVLVALATGSACGAGPEPAADAAYVGREVCASCHAVESALWAGSHHDRAMQEATPETLLGDFDDATVTYGDVTSTFLRRDTGFVVRTDGPDGEMAEYPVAYTFGVDPLQQILLPLPGGRYQALGIAWDARPASAGGQRWFHLYPDAAIDATSALHWTRPAQNWNTICADCHSTGLDIGFDVATGSFETTWAEIDVSCEACHGPGSRHVRMTRAGDVDPNTWPGTGLPAALGDPGRAWSRAPGAAVATRAAPPASRAEIETCGHCHSRRAAIGGRYTAGDAFLDAYRPSLLHAGLYHADGQIDDEVYVYGSFLQSRMYAAGVTCSDCHDPHSLRLRAEGNAVCTRCHAAERYDTTAHHHHDAATAGASCVECHMPAKTYMQVDPRRDHGLRIPRPDLSRDFGVPNACSGCHTDRSATWAADAVERWHGPVRAPHFAETVQRGRAGDPAAFASLVELAQDPAQPAIVRGTALSLLGGYPRASAIEALRAGLGDPEPLVRLGALEGMDGRAAPAVAALAYSLLDDSLRALRIEATRLLAVLPPAPTTPERAAALAKGVSEYEQVLRSSAHSSAWVSLGDLYGARGQPADAEAAYRTALAIDSTDRAAYLNLADLQRALGRDDLAEELLSRALDVSPESPEVLHALGLLHVRRGDVTGALPLLESAARSGEARFMYVHGVALVSAGEMERGLEVLELALRAHPWDRDILAALAAYSRDRGDVEAALRYLERLADVLPEDADVRGLLRELQTSRR